MLYLSYTEVSTVTYSYIGYTLVVYAQLRPKRRLTKTKYDFLLEEHVLTDMALSPLSPRLKPRAHV